MKVVLAQKHSVKGIFYGPGEADVTEEVHAILARRGALNHPLASFPPLINAGYTNLADAQAETDDRLLSIDGIGPAMVKRIREVK